MNDEFCYLLRVRYAECDAQKVVFNGRYVDYIDIAFTEFARVVWGDYNDLLSEGMDSQVVSISMDWKAPAHFDDIIAVRLKPVGIGTTSYTLQADFYNYESSKLLASAKIVYVMVRVAEHVKMRIPEDMRRQLEKGASGVTVDHAGAKAVTG